MIRIADRIQLMLRPTGSLRQRRSPRKATPTGCSASWSASLIRQAISDSRKGTMSWDAAGPLSEKIDMPKLTTDTRHDIVIEDIEYQRQGGRAMLARLYRPGGSGPFPAILQVHGGAWVNKDRTDNDFIAKVLVESGIAVASIDFRMPPEAGYPA